MSSVVDSILENAEGLHYAIDDGADPRILVTDFFLEEASILNKEVKYLSKKSKVKFPSDLDIINTLRKLRANYELMINVGIAINYMSMVEDASSDYNTYLIGLQKSFMALSDTYGFDIRSTEKDRADSYHKLAISILEQMKTEVSHVELKNRLITLKANKFLKNTHKKFSKYIGETEKNLSSFNEKMKKNRVKKLKKFFTNVQISDDHNHGEIDHFEKAKRSASVVMYGSEILVQIIEDDRIVP